MAHIHQPNHHHPLWVQMWYAFACSATGVGFVVLLLVLAAIAIYGG